MAAGEPLDPYWFLNKQVYYSFEDSVKVEKIKSIIYEWTNKQGHESCWYYPDVFHQIANIVGIKVGTPAVIPREEFCKGCKRYQEDLYGREQEFRPEEV